MRTKRSLSLLLAAALLLALTACGAAEEKQQSTDMSIGPAQLTEEETALMELLGIGMDPYRIFDFQMGGKAAQVQSIRFRAYELSGSDWSCVADASRTFTDQAGRVALTFGKMTDGVQVSYQSENNSGGVSFSMEASDTEGMAFVTSPLGSAAGLELEQEVPLVLQFATAKADFSIYDATYFGMPRELAKKGYEHVYAITVTFSQEAPGQPTVAEPSIPSGEPAATAAVRPEE